MNDLQNLVFLKLAVHAGLINEAVRRAMSLPPHADSDPKFVRKIIEAEVLKGNITMFSLMRAISRVF